MKLNFSDFTIIVQQGLNSAILAVSTFSKSGELAYTTNDKTLYVSDGTVFRQVPTTLTVVTKTGAYTAVGTDSVVFCNTTSSAFTITLPAASSCKGREYVVQDSAGQAGVNNITVGATAGTINGAATKVISTAYGALVFVSDGSNWFAR